MSLSGGPKVNKFEQVSNVGHQMSVARGAEGPRSDVQEGGLYSEVKGIMGNGHMETPDHGQT